MKAKFLNRLLIVFLCSWTSNAVQAQPAQEKIELQGDLKLGAPQTRTLAPGTIHEWHLALAKGQFAVVEVSQKNSNVEWYAVRSSGQVVVEVSQKSIINVTIHIVDPAGALRGTFNDPKDNGETEKAAWISDTEGVWMVKIATLAAGQTGDYEIKWTVHREATATDGSIIQADSLDSIAHADLAQGKQAEAKSRYEQALNIRLEVLGPDHLKVAASLNFLSDLYNKQRRFAAADSLLEKALAIREKVLGPDHPALTRTLIPLALFRNTRRRFPESESLLQRALTIQEKSPEPNYTQVADILLHLGAIVRGQNKYAEAEPFYMRALAILEKTLGPEDSKVAEGCNNLARLYRDQGKYAEAEPLNRRALAIAEKNFGSSHRNVAVCQTNLAVILSRLGKKYAEAESLHTRAVATMEKVLGPNHSQVAMLLNNLALLHLAQSKYVQARTFFEKALAIHQKAGTTGSLEMIGCLANLIDTILKQDRSKGDTCLILLDRAFDLLKAKPEQFYLYARAYRFRGQIRRLQREDKGALDDFIKALRYAERLRSQSGKSETTRADYFEAFTQVFDQIVGLQLQTGQLHEAFTYSERARAGVLSQALQEAAARAFAGIPDSLLQKDKTMREQMAAIEPEIKKDAPKKSPADSLKSKNLEEQYLVLAAAHNALLKHLEKDYPRYYDLKYQTRTVSVPELQKNLAARVAVFEYFVGDSALHIFAVTKDRFEVITLPKDSGFVKLVEAFYSAVRKADTPQFLSSAHALYKLLIAPVEKKIAVKKRLIIIPHNILYKVPFEALLKTPVQFEGKTVDYRALDYLVKPFDISYHYSATLYAKSLQEHAKPSADNAAPPNGFMGFAPVFRDKDKTGYTLVSHDLPLWREKNGETLRAIVVDGRKFGELKHSEGEVKSIVTLFIKKTKDEKNIGYFHAQATEQNFKADIKNYRYVHIATHSFINPDKPALSGIVFAQPTDSTVSEDGVLYAAETYNLELTADLVVLSSCESGLGKLIQGEGMMAMTRGFLYSGAANLIFSLWKVPDQHTRDLMVAFYRHMLEGKSYSQALRLAKLKMMANKATAAPRLWSSFVLMDN